MYVWINGTFYPINDNNLSFETHALNYGGAVFEGIRSYRQPNGGGAVFRLIDHVERLIFGATQMGLWDKNNLPYSREQIEQAIIETLRRNSMTEGYIRPLVFNGAHKLGLGAEEEGGTVFAIFVKPWDNYSNASAKLNGLKIGLVTDIRRDDGQCIVRGVKTGYEWSAMLKRLMKQLGFDCGLMLDRRGYVAEGLGWNFFYTSRGTLFTPQAHSILPGITRDTIRQMATRQGIHVVEQDEVMFNVFCRANGMFACGTAMELTPIACINNLSVGGEGTPCEMTMQLQRDYMQIVRGHASNLPAGWLTPFRID